MLFSLQDLNRLPQNVMPALIEGHEEEDESDVEQDDIEEDVRFFLLFTSQFRQ